MDANIDKYSVLMSVYYKEKGEYLKLAMDSIWNQTIPTDDFVLVCDGPLTPELNRIIEKMEKTHPNELKVVRIENNSGLGNALNAGMDCCKNELVARMDSDDISRPDRCEKQLRVFKNNPEVCICSGTIEEFIHTTQNRVSSRVLPETQKEIIRFAKNRNPFNHACAMVKKQSIYSAGGYKDFYYLEDYYLWIRMLLNGAIGYNLQEPLLWVRVGEEMYKRRGGWKYIKSQISLFEYMREKQFITSCEFLRNILVRVIAALIPNNLRSFMYRKLLRE